MKRLLAVGALCFGLTSVGQQLSEAPTGFDNKSNGMVGDTTHQSDQTKFDEIETVQDGLGLLYT